MTGFNTPSYFSQCFKKEFGMLPSDFNWAAQKTSWAEPDAHFHLNPRVKHSTK
jgi:AraC-like DNA-binding protein